MESECQNPFAGYGSIVFGEKFIRRPNDEEIIFRRVIKYGEPGNLAIIGDHRVGKSSLVYNVISEYKEVLFKKLIVPIWMNVASIDSAEDFFRALVNESYDKLVELDVITPKLVELSKGITDIPYTNWTDFLRHIKHYFKNIRLTGYKILFVLDEFDHTRNLFQDDKTRFQAVRDLSYYPEHRVYYLCISRRSINYIEARTGTSTIEGIFEKHHLGLFDSASCNLYYEKMSTCGLNVEQELINKIDMYCGNHPYLLSMLGYEIIEAFFKHGFSSSYIDIAAKKLERMFLDQYDRMIDLLKEDGSLDELIQVILGPLVNVKQSDVDDLVRYGTIHVTESGSYKSFSSHFDTYLRMVEREIEIWPLWAQTERLLRRIITNKLSNSYGENWLEFIEKKNNKIKPIIDACRLAQQKEAKAFGSRASQELLDFTYPADLFAIIFSEWKQNFQPVFGRDTNYWSQRSELLSKIRNPLAHNRGKVLSDFEQTTAEGYCKEILAILQAHIVD